MKEQSKQPEVVAQPLPIKYAELSDQELEVIAGGIFPPIRQFCNRTPYRFCNPFVTLK